MTGQWVAFLVSALLASDRVSGSQSYLSTLSPAMSMGPH